MINNKKMGSLLLTLVLPNLLSCNFNTLQSGAANGNSLQSPAPSIISSGLPAQPSAAGNRFPPGVLPVYPKPLNPVAAVGPTPTPAPGTSPRPISSPAAPPPAQARPSPSPSPSPSPNPSPSPSVVVPSPSPKIVMPSPSPVPAQSPPGQSSVIWKGHTWKVTHGGMAGVIQGSPNNVYVDSKGYLHLQINKNGSTWTGAEIFTTDNIGFGTYLWQVEGPLDNLDKSTVFGIFPYGPAAGIGVDGENELDTEFSRWNNPDSTNTDFCYYPPEASGPGRVAADLFNISLSGGNLTTIQMYWSSKTVVGTILSGLQPMNSSTNVLRSFTFAPANPTNQVPQVPLPLGINLWSFGAPPATNQEVILRDFQYVP